MGPVGGVDAAVFAGGGMDVMISGGCGTAANRNKKKRPNS